MFLIGFALGATLTARRMTKQMSNLHDDMLAKVQKLKERAQAAAAKGTQMEQNWTDVSAQLDEVTKILDDFIKDDASSGGSTGGAAISVSGEQQQQTGQQQTGQQQTGQQQTGQQQQSGSGDGGQLAGQATQRGSDPSGKSQPGASNGQAADSAKDQGWQAR